MLSDDGPIWQRWYAIAGAAAVLLLCCCLVLFVRGRSSAAAKMSDSGKVIQVQSKYLPHEDGPETSPNVKMKKPKDSPAPPPPTWDAKGGRPRPRGTHSPTSPRGSVSPAPLSSGPGAARSALASPPPPEGRSPHKKDRAARGEGPDTSEFDATPAGLLAQELPQASKVRWMNATKKGKLVEFYTRKGQYDMLPKVDGIIKQHEYTTDSYAEDQMWHKLAQKYGAMEPDPELDHGDAASSEEWSTVMQLAMSGQSDKVREAKKNVLSKTSKWHTGKKQVAFNLATSAFKVPSSSSKGHQTV